MLEISSIKKGIVLDHIASGNGVKIFNKLLLHKAVYPVALLMNVPSNQMEKKDIIKIENNINVDLNFLGLIDNNITINIIENSNIINKKKVKVPAYIEDIFPCHNPRCITNFDDCAKPTFFLVDKTNLEYRCDYCEEITTYKI